MYCFTMQHSFDPSMLIVHHPIELGDPLQMNRWVCRGFALTCPGWLCCNGEWTRAIVTPPYVLSVGCLCYSAPLTLRCSTAKFLSLYKNIYSKPI